MKETEGDYMNECKICGKQAMYGGGETARCLEHLPAHLVSPITYKEYHKPTRDPREDN